jgi:hypothetical protein
MVAPLRLSTKAYHHSQYSQSEFSHRNLKNIKNMGILLRKKAISGAAFYVNSIYSQTRLENYRFIAIF